MAGTDSIDTTGLLGCGVQRGYNEIQRLIKNYFGIYGLSFYVPKLSLSRKEQRQLGRRIAILRACNFWYTWKEPRLMQYGLEVDSDSILTKRNRLVSS